MQRSNCRRRITITAALIFSLGIVVHLIAATSDIASGPVKLGELPKVTLQNRPPLTDKQIQHIRELIISLSSLDKPDFGLSATLSGTSFSPIPGQNRVQMLLLTDHHLGQSTALRELVTLGPDALPFLLDALDDETPTKVVIRHDGGFGGMWFAREYGVNPANPAEAKADDHPLEDDLPKKEIKTYTVRVGDVCFVAIGQIVGRQYAAVRYQPTACIVINGPTNNPVLCARIRNIWKSDDSRRKVFESLCADYSTVGIFNGESLDGWDVGNEFQCSAATRLLFYFPDETKRVLASRLEQLNVGGGDFVRRCVANGVRSDDFIKAVAWSSDPIITVALTGIFKRADNLDDLLAALPAVKDEALIRARLEARLVALPLDDPGPYGDGYHLLQALVQHAPNTAKPMFDGYLQHPALERSRAVIGALQGAKVPWDIELLLPMLADKRTFGWEYAVVAGQNEPRLPIRVCDEAAQTLSQNHPELKFTQVGTHEDLNRQIAAIQTALGKKIGR